MLLDEKRLQLRLLFRPISVFFSDTRFGTGRLTQLSRRCDRKLQKGDDDIPNLKNM